MKCTAFLLTLLSVGCGQPTPAPPAEAPAAPATDPLINRVWRRTDSTGLPGIMRIYLSDGTQLMDSCWETYRLTRWRRDSDSTLVWDEDGRSITAALGSLSDSSLELRVQLGSETDTQHYTAASSPFTCPDMKR